MVKPKARIDEQQCLACGGCIAVCPEDAIIMSGTHAMVQPGRCIGCGICVKTCPVGAIDQGEIER
jgi:ferredoxin